METINIVKRILSKLDIDIKVSDTEFKPIRDVLRESWYVDKLIKLGYKNCIHLDLGNSFIAILDDDTLMTGRNCMIGDCFDTIMENADVPYSDAIKILKYNLDRFDAQIYEDERDDENFLVIFEICALYGIVHDLLNYE